MRKWKQGTNSLQGVSNFVFARECFINLSPRYLPINFSCFYGRRYKLYYANLEFVKSSEICSFTVFLEVSLLPLFTKMAFSSSHNFLSPSKHTVKLTECTIDPFLPSNYFILFLSVQMPLDCSLAITLAQWAFFCSLHPLAYEWCYPQCAGPIYINHQSR